MDRKPITDKTVTLDSSLRDASEFPDTHLFETVFKRPFYKVERIEVVQAMFPKTSPVPPAVYIKFKSSKYGEIHTPFEEFFGTILLSANNDDVDHILTPKMENLCSISALIDQLPDITVELFIHDGTEFVPWDLQGGRVILKLNVKGSLDKRFTVERDTSQIKEPFEGQKAPNFVTKKYDDVQVPHFLVDRDQAVVPYEFMGQGDFTLIPYYSTILIILFLTLLK